MQPDQEKPDHQNERDSRFNQYRAVDSDIAKLIMAFAAPMLAHCTTYEARRDAVSYAVLCWNLSLDDATERQRIEGQIEAQYPAEKKAQIIKLIDFLISRKNERYADNRFYIIDYEITRKGENMELTVTTKYLPRKSL